MSKSAYTLKQYQVVTLLCTWTENGRQRSYDFSSGGDIFDTLDACYKNVIGARYPDFSVTVKSIATIQRKST